MKITFNLEYHTVWGQMIHISGSCSELGAGDPTKAPAMKHEGYGRWSLTVDIKEEQTFEYNYFITVDDIKSICEWGKTRKITPSKNNNLSVYDHWQPLPLNKAFFSSAFAKDIFAHADKAADKKQTADKFLTIRCFAPTLRSNQKLAICGNCKSLGEWNPELAVVMNGHNHPEWSVSVPASGITFPLEFKFLITDQKEQQIIAWESGDNRSFSPESTTGKTDDIIISGLMLNNPLPLWKGAGVAIPVFSLRSEQGFGIGEFNDLKKMIDWAVMTGQKFIQILPINDTTMTHSWTDSYPYNANSIFALHPAYVNLDKIGKLKSKAKKDKFKELQSQLNALTEIDYERVTSAKWEYIREVFVQNGMETLDSKEFKAFFRQNSEWLVPYAAFCYLRDVYQTPDFNLWKENSVYNSKEIKKLTSSDNPAYNEIALHYFIQYHLHIQMLEVREYAYKNHVVIKGDIPIGISRHSVEAWCDARLFNMDSQAGAPPDDFSRDGQNWGFPTYNWEVMKKDDYSWWKKRFAKMSDYFDAYRIDHILGFFRIWEIPENAVQGLLGHFSPALPFSAQDMRWFDFYFNYDRHATPFIRDYMIKEIFGEYAEEVKKNYLDKSGDDSYTLRKGFDTQRSIQINFTGVNNDKGNRIRKGLFELVSEVIFVEDPRQKGMFHPRISAQYTYSYRSMDEGQKQAFNRLYDDFFYHRHDQFWKEQAMEKLPALINATDMLVCGEDLGMIPHCVEEVMSNLQILSLEIQRMPKDPKSEFGIPAYYPYLSVCTTSTHDMNPIRAWWEEDRGVTQRFFNNVLHQPGQAPYYCEPWVCDMIVDQHLWSPAMLTILPLQDWISTDKNLRRGNPADERINVPAIPRYYWRYRMHISLEELIKSDEFNTRLSEKIKRCGR